MFVIQQCVKRHGLLRLRANVLPVCPTVPFFFPTCMSVCLCQSGWMAAVFWRFLSLYGLSAWLGFRSCLYPGALQWRERGRDRVVESDHVRTLSHATDISNNMAGWANRNNVTHNAKAMVLCFDVC